MAGVPLDEPDVTFLDLDALVDVDARGTPRLRPAARTRLDPSRRYGVIAGGASARGSATIEATLEALGVGGLFDETLTLDSASLPLRPWDPRVFAVAAALAGVAADDCLFLTLNPARAAAAGRAGMRAELLGGRRASAAVAFTAADGGAPDEAAALIDEDTGPTFVLEGRIVTMTRRGAFDGRIAVRRGRIVALSRAGESLPPTLRSVPVTPVDGSIYPGLIDLHNHYVYDIAPLWRVPRRYTNRTEWGDVDSKKAGVSLPVKLLAGWAPTARAIARYVEAKALIGGTTSGQGMKTQVRGGFSLFHGAMRNVEGTDDPRLPDSATLVPSIGRRAQDFAAFRRSLEKRQRLGGSYFYHLAEGTNELTRRTYTDLRDNDLLLPSLAGIHALALRPEDLRDLAAGGAKLVWSPFSNLLLYGQTIDLRALLRSRVRFAIGCDWTPSGSRNLLQELKVARHVTRAQGVAGRLDSERLVRAVTADAAAILGWSPRIGALRPGAFADLLVIAGRDGDDYDRLIDATERDVRLVTVHGVPRYGDAGLMEALHADPGQPLEPWRVNGTAKALNFASAGSPLNGLTLAAATQSLQDAFGDLHAFRDVVATGTEQLRALGVEPQDTFSLVLDNEDGGAGDGGAFTDVALTDLSLLPERIELDDLTVGGRDYWSRVEDQPNLDAPLKEALRAAYP